jgi:hypothetical protein
MKDFTAMAWKDGDGYNFRTAACVSCAREKRSFEILGGDVSGFVETDEPVGRSPIDGTTRCAFHLWVQKQGPEWIPEKTREAIAHGERDDDPEALEELLQAQIERGAIPNDPEVLAEIRRQLAERSRR